MVTDNPMPRPFCGNIPEVREDSRYPFGFDGPVPAWEVVCTTLGCPVWNADNTYYLDRDQAVRAWNTRRGEGCGLPFP